SLVLVWGLGDHGHELDELQRRRHTMDDRGDELVAEIGRDDSDGGGAPALETAGHHVGAIAESAGGLLHGLARLRIHQSRLAGVQRPRHRRWMHAYRSEERRVGKEWRARGSR